MMIRQTPARAELLDASPTGDELAGRRDASPGRGPLAEARPRGLSWRETPALRFVSKLWQRGSCAKGRFQKVTPKFLYTTLQLAIGEENRPVLEEGLEEAAP